MAKAKPRAGELTTANYRWTKPTVGASDDAWGGYINADLDGIDSVVYGIQTSIPTVPAASTTPPIMDGTASAGSSASWSRGDHIHPTDTSRAAVSAIPAASSTAPAMNGTVAVGVGTTWARADHVHPTDTTRAPIAGLTNGSNAAAGQVGEWISASVVSGSAVTVSTSGTYVAVASITLTPGDWDVDGVVFGSGSAPPAQYLSAGVNTSIAVPLQVSANGAFAAFVYATGLGNGSSATIGRSRWNVTVSTLVYLVATVGFSSGTGTVWGAITARRMR